MTTMSIRARRENGQQINESEEWAGGEEQPRNEYKHTH